jgi:hypothetical protein
VSFHTFALTEDRCLRLLVKNLGRRMRESVVREELDSLNILVQGVMQLRSSRHDHDSAKNRPPIPASLFRWLVRRMCRKSDHSPKSADCECRCSRTSLQKAGGNASAASASDTHSVTTVTRLGESRVGAPKFPGGALPRGNSLSAVAPMETTRRTTGAVLCGKRRGLPLLRKRPYFPEERRHRPPRRSETSTGRVLC